MFEYFLRKTMLKKLDKEDQDVILLCKDQIKMYYFSVFLVELYALIPIMIMFVLIFSYKDIMDIIVWGIFSVVISLFISWFRKKFKEDIFKFTNLISSTLYFERYVTQGKAISKREFSKIRKKKEYLYDGIRYQRVQGFCYSVCFEIIECLEKGEIHFVAVKNLPEDKKDDGKEYTMHVLYVNRTWCYDTYSQRQYPLEEIMKVFKGKTYKRFTYEDVQGKTYDEFRDEQYEALKKWCEENDCYQGWKKEE